MSDLRSLDVVVHGTRADSAKLRTAVGLVRDLGHRVRVHVTWERGDARRLARRAAGRGDNVVVAAGGDGTLNEVVNGVLAAGGRNHGPAAIGIVPLGTANDFARQVGIPSDIEAALRLAALGQSSRVDVGRVNGRAFLNVSTLGAAARVTREANASAKQALGVLAYAISGVRQLAANEPPTVARISGPGFSREIPFFLLVIGNGRATGGGTTVTPLADLNDALLDVCVIEPVARTSLAKLLVELRLGDHLDRDGVHYVQTPWLRVESARPLPANVDGESIRARTFEYVVEASAVELVAPTQTDADDVAA